MGLVARGGAVRVCPGCPLLGEVLKQQVAECLTVVSHDVGVCGNKLGQMRLEFVAAAFLELLEEGGSPGGLAYFVAVVEEGARIGRAGALEGFFDVFQVVGNGLSVEVVNDQALAAGCGTLHLHDTIFNIYGNGLRGLLRLQVNHLSVLVVGHDAVQAAVDGILTRQREVRSRARCDVPLDEDDPAGALLQWHPRSAEGPSCACGHVELYAVLPALLAGVSQHFHPLVGEVGNVVRLVTLDAI